MPAPTPLPRPVTRRTSRHAALSATVLLAAVALLLAVPVAAAGQRSLDGLRVGVTLGGTSFVGLSFELFSDNRAVDLTVGTWGFDDVSVAVRGKALFGASSFRPSVGAGLWLVWAAPDPDDPEATRSGVTVLATAPVGFDLRLAGGHYLDAHLNLSRGLWIRRTDPDDDTPLRKRVVPLPGLAYRWDPNR